MNRAETRRLCKQIAKVDPLEMVGLTTNRACQVLRKEFGFGDQRITRFLRAMEGKDD